MSEHRGVLVVGAGPVGLFGALRLAQQGVDVLVVEAGSELGTTSKASTFHPSTLDLLDEAGAAEELLPLGVVVDEIQWRDLAGDILASVPFSVLEGRTGFPYRLHAEQTLLTPILLRKLRELNPDSVRFSSRCVSVEQGDGSVTATIAGFDGATTVTSGFLLAADGAHSEIRKQLGIGFPGASYESRALRVVTKEDLREHLSNLTGIAYVRDERQSCSLLHMRDHWRFIFRVAGKQSDAEVLDPEAVRELIDAVAPGVSIDFSEVYSNRAHIAERYVSGRVALAGDAAHVTTTAGGMNMNCGLHDAYAFARAMAEVLGGAPLSALEETGAARRGVVKDVIIPRTESRAAGSDGDADALARAVASTRELAADPERAFRFLYEASMFDTAPSLRGER
ncbi:FAD-dependent monooxygenase [Leucobacter sp. CSA1]|uniref:FAD-dependent monooxygenase n=1 Tax=Leucobacter chromiisoli TaxID=2796471 RepID=A0A934UW07_9MICO|nr:FAD-dependent oxidoreductase [Leucobacter chromiisoli]MBK0419778.1 FAD-dependent monooxygenase [Leucobacter chromiisoli]